MVLLFDVVRYEAGLLAILLKKPQVNKAFKELGGSNSVGIQRKEDTISSFGLI
jgi:hypothetical protein